MLRTRSLRVLVFFFALVSEFLLLKTSVRALGTVGTLHSFNYYDGTNPLGSLLLDAAGNLYGTTSQNGSTGAGTVYELLPNGAGQWGYEVLYTFCSLPGCSDGIGPQSGLTWDAAGNLYGTTSQGGNFGCGHGCGTVFELTPSSNGGWTETVLYTFSGGSDGATPVGTLALDSVGNVYGTTSSGGGGFPYCSQGCGVLFRLHRGTDGKWTQKVLHSFCSVSGCLDGAVPKGLGIVNSGSLYCTTSQLGRYNGGTLLQVTPGSDGQWKGKVLHAFGSGSDGSSPNWGLVFDGRGSLYGTTNNGGRHFAGVVFELSPGSNGQWKENILHSFCSATNCLDGAFPSAGLIMDSAGHLYGPSSSGGTTGYGIIFMLTLEANGGWKETVVYDSLSGNLDNPLNLSTTGEVFSATTNGGQYNLGSVFEIIP